MHGRDLSNACGYFRVSTQQQAVDSAALDNYIHRFLSFGFTLDRIYYDIASGGNNKREAYQQILKLVRSGTIARVYVPEISRISRDIVHFQEVIDTFKRSGAELYTLDNHKFDFDTPTGSTNVKLMVLFAEQERLNNQWRSLKGYEFLRSEQRAIRACFGYVKSNGILIPNTHLYQHTNYTVWQVAQSIIEIFLSCGGTSRTIRQATALYKTTKSKRVDTDDFPRTHGSLREWLMSAAIRGHLEYFGGRNYKNKPDKSQQHQIIYNTHEPLISKETATKISDLLKSSASSRQGLHTLRNPLRNLIFCVCGSPMKSSSSTSRGRQYLYLVCRSAYPNDSYRITLQENGQLKRCDRRSTYGLTLQSAEDYVIRQLTLRADLIADSLAEDSNDNKNQQTPEIEALQQSIQTYERLVLTDADLISVLETKRERLRQLQLAQFNQNPSTTQLQEKLVIYAKDAAFWQLATVQEKLLLYNDFIERIVCDRGQLAITFRF